MTVSLTDLSEAFRNTAGHYLVLSGVFIISGIIGLFLGMRKGRGWLGFLLGFCLLVLGWLVIAVVPARRIIRAKGQETAHFGVPIDHGISTTLISTCISCSKPIRDIGSLTHCPRCGKPNHESCLGPNTGQCRLCRRGYIANLLVLDFLIFTPSTGFLIALYIMGQLGTSEPWMAYVGVYALFGFFYSGYELAVNFWALSRTK